MKAGSIDELAVSLARRAMESGGPETGSLEIGMVTSQERRDRTFGVVVTVAEVRKPLVQVVQSIVQ